ncbi:MBOAT family protein [Thalassospira sp. NFXS8]|uniref:MBOAT family O-acyltransferase n=1 Tax=Thalassospira sp. NFXS8 TaxID=2819093 RepID=UPI0032DE8053
MEFHSLQYLVFLPSVVILHFLLPFRFRWALLLAASYFFYASWRVDFIVLLVASTLTDYIAGLCLDTIEDKIIRKFVLGVSLFVNLGLLFIFKYVDSIWVAISGVLSFLFRVDPSSLPEFDIILPLGISFYTFQTISYTIDVYRKRIKAERHLGYFALYVAFFPQLLAGPIERAAHLLSEIRANRSFDVRWITPAYFMIVMGLAKKLVIANRIGRYLAPIIADPLHYSPLEVLLTPAATVYQYYCDLSGYADIALGSAMLLGIQLNRNFDRPFAASSTMRFWYCWHITVTAWFRDYLLRPLVKGGSVAASRPLALMITGLVIGLWHGPSLGWIVAGCSVGLLAIPEGKWLRWRVRHDFKPRNSIHRFLWSWMGRLYVWIVVFFLIGLPLTWNDISILKQVIVHIINLQDNELEFVSINFETNSQTLVLLIISIIALETWQWLSARRVTERISASMFLEVRWLLATLFGVFVVIFSDLSQPGFLYFKF